MNRRNLIAACAFFACIAISTAAFADDSCTWSKQTDGSTWGTCVDDSGTQYCVSCPSGTTPSTSCSHVSCNG